MRNIWCKIIILRAIMDNNLGVFLDNKIVFNFQGFVPGIWGVSHGAIQFMAYEEMKTRYNNYKVQPIDTKLVIFCNRIKL